MSEDSHPAKQPPRKPLSAPLAASTPQVGPSGGPEGLSGPHRGAQGISVILLAGARHLTEPGIVSGTIADIALNIADGPTVIRHGACPGPRSADQAASDWIRDCGEWLGVTEDSMPADWDHCAPNCPTDPRHRRIKKPGDIAHPGNLPDYCPTAGPRRNTAMVTKLPRPEYMIAFPEPGQPNYGTNGCIRLAEQAGIPVRRITA